MDPTPLPSGARFGRYVIDHVLGRGSFGVVYAARRDDLPRLVALKVLHRELSHHAEVVARFHTEARAIAELKHPHIVDVHDVGAHDGVPFIAMELLEGETLGHRIDRENVLSLDVALDLLFPIFSAVSAVHARGFVHRDIKPDNILLAEILPGRLHPKLLDFGVAKVSARGRGMTRTGAAVGTPYYMSPEQAEEAREADAASDQWSLAVLLYRAITGSYPFDGRSVVKILHAIIEDAPLLPSTLLPTCPAVVERALLRALSKSPARRYPNIRAFGSVLLPFASRRTREDWRLEFVDTEARTLQTEQSSRPQTQRGPVFQVIQAAMRPPDASSMYDDEQPTEVNVDAARVGDTVPNGILPMVFPTPPIAPLPPTSLGAPQRAYAPPMGPPLADVRGAFPTPVSRPPAPLEFADQVSPRPSAPQSTFSFGSHSVNPLDEARSTRRMVYAAAFVAVASVFACVVVYARSHLREPTVSPTPRPASAATSTATMLSPTIQGSRPTATAEAPVAASSDAGAIAAVVAETRAPPRRGSAHTRPSSHPATPQPEVAPPPAAPRAAELLRLPEEEAAPAEGGAGLPERLTRSQINAVLRGATRDIERCGGRGSGTILVSFAVSGDGVPNNIEVSGTLGRGDTQTCVLNVVQALTFPQSLQGVARISQQYRVGVIDQHDTALEPVR